MYISTPLQVYYIAKTLKNLHSLFGDIFINHKIFITECLIKISDPADALPYNFCKQFYGEINSTRMWPYSP